MGLGFRQKIGWEMGFGENFGWEMGFVTTPPPPFQDPLLTAEEKISNFVWAILLKQLQNNI